MQPFTPPVRPHGFLRSLAGPGGLARSLACVAALGAAATTQAYPASDPVDVFAPERVVGPDTLYEVPLSAFEPVTQAQAVQLAVAPAVLSYADANGSVEIALRDTAGAISYDAPLTYDVSTETAAGRRRLRRGRSGWSASTARAGGSADAPST